MHSNSKTKKVFDFLRKNVGHSYNVKTISRCLHLPESTVKVCVHRLWRNGLIYPELKGMYQAYVDISMLSALENPPTTLHGIMLQVKTIEKLQKCMDGIPSHEFTEKALMWFHAHEFEPTTNYRFHRSIWVEGRRVTITIHLKGLIDVSINSTSNPLTYPDFLKVLTFLDGFLEGFAPFRDRRVIDLLQIGIAKDYRYLRLDGLSGASLKAFTNAWVRIYYKEDLKVTRIEHHLVGRMNLDGALRSLSILTNPVNYKDEYREDDPDNPSYG